MQRVEPIYTHKFKERRLGLCLSCITCEWCRGEFESCCCACCCPLCTFGSRIEWCHPVPDTDNPNVCSNNALSYGCVHVLASAVCGVGHAVLAMWELKRLREKKGMEPALVSDCLCALCCFNCLAFQVHRGIEPIKRVG